MPGMQSRPDGIRRTGFIKANPFDCDPTLVNAEGACVLGSITVDGTGENNPVVSELVQEERFSGGSAENLASMVLATEGKQYNVICAESKPNKEDFGCRFIFETARRAMEVSKEMTTRFALLKGMVEEDDDGEEELDIERLMEAVEAAASTKGKRDSEMDFVKGLGSIKSVSDLRDIVKRTKAFSNMVAGLEMEVVPHVDGRSKLHLGVGHCEAEAVRLWFYMSFGDRETDGQVGDYTLDVNDVWTASMDLQRQKNEKKESAQQRKRPKIQKEESNDPLLRLDNTHALVEWLLDNYLTSEEDAMLVRLVRELLPFSTFRGNAVDCNIKYRNLKPELRQLVDLNKLFSPMRNIVCGNSTETNTMIPAQRFVGSYCISGDVTAEWRNRIMHCEKEKTLEEHQLIDRLKTAELHFATLQETERSMRAASGRRSASENELLCKTRMCVARVLNHTDCAAPLTAHEFQQHMQEAQREIDAIREELCQFLQCLPYNIEKSERLTSDCFKGLPIVQFGSVVSKDELDHILEMSSDDLQTFVTETRNEKLVPLLTALSAEQREDVLIHVKDKARRVKLDVLIPEQQLIEDVSAQDVFFKIEQRIWTGIDNLCMYWNDYVRSTRVTSLAFDHGTIDNWRADAARKSTERIGDVRSAPKGRFDGPRGETIIRKEPTGESSTMNSDYNAVLLNPLRRASGMCLFAAGATRGERVLEALATVEMLLECDHSPIGMKAQWEEAKQLFSVTKDAGDVGNALLPSYSACFDATAHQVCFRLLRSQADIAHYTGIAWAMLCGFIGNVQVNNYERRDLVPIDKACMLITGKPECGKSFMAEAITKFMLVETMFDGASESEEASRIARPPFVNGTQVYNEFQPCFMDPNGTSKIEEKKTIVSESIIRKLRAQPVAAEDRPENGQGVAGTSVTWLDTRGVVAIGNENDPINCGKRGQPTLNPAFVSRMAMSYRNLQAPPGEARIDSDTNKRQRRNNHDLDAVMWASTKRLWSGAGALLLFSSTITAYLPELPDFRIDYTELHTVINAMNSVLMDARLPSIPSRKQQSMIAMTRGMTFLRIFYQFFFISGGEFEGVTDLYDVLRRREYRGVFMSSLYVSRQSAIAAIIGTEDEHHDYSVKLVIWALAQYIFEGKPDFLAIFAPHVVPVAPTAAKMTTVVTTFATMTARFKSPATLYSVLADIIKRRFPNVQMDASRIEELLRILGSDYQYRVCNHRPFQIVCDANPITGELLTSYNLCDAGQNNEHHVGVSQYQVQAAGIAWNKAGRPVDVNESHSWYFPQQVPTRITDKEVSTPSFEMWKGQKGWEFSLATALMHQGGGALMRGDFKDNFDMLKKLLNRLATPHTVEKTEFLPAPPTSSSSFSAHLRGVRTGPGDKPPKEAAIDRSDDRGFLDSFGVSPTIAIGETTMSSTRLSVCDLDQVDPDTSCVLRRVQEAFSCGYAVETAPTADLPLAAGAGMLRHFLVAAAELLLSRCLGGASHIDLDAPVDQLMQAVPNDDDLIKRAVWCILEEFPDFVRPTDPYCPDHSPVDTSKAGEQQAQRRLYFLAYNLVRFCRSRSPEDYLPISQLSTECSLQIQQAIADNASELARNSHDIADAENTYDMDPASPHHASDQRLEELHLEEEMLQAKATKLKKLAAEQKHAAVARYHKIRETLNLAEGPAYLGVALKRARSERGYLTGKKWINYMRIWSKRMIVAWLQKYPQGAQYFPVTQKTRLGKPIVN